MNFTRSSPLLIKKSGEALAISSGIDEQYAVHKGCARQQQRRCQDAGAERS
jgi:hypothetical protein